MRISAHEVARFVAARHNLTFDGLCSDRRSRAYARPRQIAMYAIKTLCGHMSYPAIGRLLGGRDHTTVMHGVERIEEFIKTDPKVAHEVRIALAHFRDKSTEALEHEIYVATCHLGNLIAMRQRHIEAVAA